jgi:hypothetical protein
MVIGTFKNLKEDLEIIKWLEIHLKELRNEMRNFWIACSKILKKSDIFTQEIYLVSNIEEGHLGDKYTDAKTKIKINFRIHCEI